MFHTKVVQKIETHILCSKTLSGDRVVCEVMWKKFWYDQTGQRCQYNTAHALLMLDN